MWENVTPCLLYRGGLPAQFRRKGNSPVNYENMLPNTRIRTYDRYKVNLATIADIVYSYGTPVAAADWTERQLLVPAYHSVTTSRHINYIAEQWNLEVVKQYAL